MEANEATQTHCYNPVAPAYPIWAYYVHGRQCRCQEDPASLPSGRLEKTTRSSPHKVAQHRPTESETTPPYTPRSSRFGSEPPSVEDDVDVWRYAILRVACQKWWRRQHIHESMNKTKCHIYELQSVLCLNCLLIQYHYWMCVCYKCMYNNKER